jgi:chromosome segregation ATPase
MKRLKISGAAANHDLSELRRHITLEATLKNYDKDIEKLRAARVAAEEKLARAKTALATAEGEFQKAYHAESSLNTNKVSADTLRKKNVRLFAPVEGLADMGAVRQHYAAQNWPV